MAPLQIHHTTLLVFYDEVRLIINNIEYSRSIKSIINDTTRWEGLSNGQKDVISKFFKLEPAPYRTLANALFVTVIAGFEDFLRNLLAGIIKEIEQKEKIPETIVNKNIQLSGVALSQFYSPPSHIKLNYAHITKNLATCFSKDSKPKLNEEIAGFLKNILDLDNVFLLLKDCEIDLTWDDFFKQPELRTILRTTKARETGKQLQKQINKYIDDRNRIAHTGLSSSEITVNMVDEAMNLFAYVGEFIVTQCQTCLSSKKGA